MAVEHQQHNEQTAETRRSQQVEPDVAEQTPELLSPASLQQLMANPAPVSPTTAQSMQRVVGNQATSQMIVAQRQDTTVQAKLTVGAVDDEYEQEADRVANRVVQMNPDNLQRQEEELVQAQVEEEEELIQGKAVADTRLQRQEEEEELQMKPATILQVQREEEEEEAVLDLGSKAADLMVFEKRTQVPSPPGMLIRPERGNRVQRNAPPAAPDQRTTSYSEQDNTFQMPEPAVRISRDEPGIPGAGSSSRVIWLAPLATLIAAQTRDAVRRNQSSEEESMTASSDGTFAVSKAVEQRILQKKGSGRRLPADIQADMERRFGADFSRVRVHTDSSSAEVSNSLKARAFTHGHDIFFNSGEASFNTREGKKLLAHELTHVVQQTGYGRKTGRR
jgi:hypothetical protein